MTGDTSDLFGSTPPVAVAADDAAASAAEIEVTISMALHDEDVGPHAVKLSEVGGRRKTVLLPRSKITVRETGGDATGMGGKKFKAVEVTMPESLANERGLL